MCAQVKRQQDPEGLLCATLAYALERMGSLADVCAICDAPLAFGEASILPSVCGRQLCAYQLAIIIFTYDKNGTNADRASWAVYSWSGSRQ